MNVAIDRHVDDIVTDEYRRLQSELVPLVAGRLDATDIHFSVREIDRFYNQAWHALLASLHVKAAVPDRATFLAETTFRRAVDAFRVTNPDRNIDADVLEALGIQDPIAEAPEQQSALGAASDRLRAESSQRELQPAALQIVHGMTEPEIAEKLGVPLERLEAILADVRAQVDPALEGIGDDELCTEDPSLVTRFALGAFDPRSDEYRDAVRHLKDCDPCRRRALAARAVAASTAPSGSMFVALTGLRSFGDGSAPIAGGPAPGAPRAASPLVGGAQRPRRSFKKILAGVAAAAVLLFGAFNLFGSGGDADKTAQTAAVSSNAAAEKAKAKKAKAKAKAKRKARAARERRAKKRAAARRRAAARARARANAQAATPVRTPTVATPAPQATPQPVQTKPKSNPQPKPSTDPSQEFGN